MGDDVFEIPETQARANWYGVTGIPDVFFDGLGRVTGAGSCTGAAAAYRDMIDARIEETGGLSPVAISSSMDIAGGNCTVTATYRLVDPVALTDLRATLLLYEDNVYWCCGYGDVDIWNGTTRAIYDENIVLTARENEVVVENTFAIGGDWDPTELHAVAYLQQTTTKEIIQGQLVGNAPPFDYSLWFERRLRSVPDGNGVAVFNAILTNIGDAADTFTLEPGMPFGDWSTDFLVCGDPNPYTESMEIELGPDESCEISVRVYTDGAVVIRNGSFLVTSSFSGRSHETDLQVYNGSYSVLFVDDDRTHSEDLIITNALDNLGYLYEDWDVTLEHGGNSPSLSVMGDFDYVIWHHSPWPQSDPLTTSDVAALMAYMDNGGSFFLTSQHFLNDPNGPVEFITDYLGVASYTLDHGYEEVEGVGGDPIGDGLVLPLDFPFSSLARGDHLEPSPTATVSIIGPNGENTTVANVMDNGAKAVFMAFPFDTISETDPDPNNTTVVLGRILDWLEPQVPAGLEEGPAAGLASRIERAQPNPFNPRTVIAFVLSPAGAAGPVRLDVFDLQGRKVAGIFEGRMSPGSHARTWDGRSDEGAVSRSGVYFVRLSTLEGMHSEKLILLK